jgi:predicted GNAT family N-acyltransferase
MKIEIKRFTIHEGHALARIALTIRTEVFVHGQQVDPALEYEYEEECTHYLLYAGGKAVATARWRETGKGIKLERFATLAEHRGKGFGTMLLKRILSDVAPFGKYIYLHAQLSAEKFYDHNGFVRVGDIFSEANIDHYLMEYRP